MLKRFAVNLATFLLLITVQSNSTSTREMGKSCSRMQCHKSCTNWIKKEEEKMDHLLDPTNMKVVEYCNSLIGVSFQGETSNKVDEITDHTEDKHEIHLGSVLQSMDVEIREKGANFTGNEEKFLEYLHMAVKFRQSDKKNSEAFREKILKDKDRFVTLLKNRKETADRLHHHHRTYWGTRQQMLSAKVVGDWIDEKNGPIDPIFGVLLNPTGGRTGPGDASFLHKELFDNNGPIAYHSAVHDAFGYLLNYHNTGPGYKYLGAASLFDTTNPLSEQVAGIDFWTKTLKHHEENNKPQCKNYQ